jgi:protein-S-isoprenylcysteine O-methyltransferase Ste14
MSLWRHVRAIGLLPVTVTVVVPAVLLAVTDPAGVGWGVPWLTALAGAALIAAGLALVVWTIGLFGTEGEGTLAPWDPTSRLVVRGPYRHVRNPMIIGVGCIVAGEAVLFGSVALLAWLAVVAALNAVYMPLVEEPGLERRFGDDYLRYRRAVPRWVPTTRPGRRSRGT